MRDFKPLYEYICLNTWWTRQSLFGKKVSAHIPLAGKWDQGSGMYWKYGFSVNIFCVYFWWRHTKHNSIIFVWHEFVNEWICQCSLAMSVWGNDGERRDLEMKERHLGKWTNEKNEKCVISWPPILKIQIQKTKRAYVKTHVNHVKEIYPFLSIHLNTDTLGTHVYNRHKTLKVYISIPLKHT